MSNADLLCLIPKFGEFSTSLLPHLPMEAVDKRDLLGGQKARPEEASEVLHSGTGRKEDENLLVRVTAQEHDEGAQLVHWVDNLVKKMYYDYLCLFSRGSIITSVLTM